MNLGLASTLMGVDNQSNYEVGVRAIVNEFEVAWNHHDMDALVSLMTLTSST
jgi:hypothetical protein